MPRIERIALRRATARVAATTRYRTIARFYAADPRRGASRERDVGLCPPGSPEPRPPADLIRAPRAPALSQLLPLRNRSLRRGEEA